MSEILLLPFIDPPAVSLITIGCLSSLCQVIVGSGYPLEIEMIPLLALLD